MLERNVDIATSGLEIMIDDGGIIQGLGLSDPALHLIEVPRHGGRIHDHIHVDDWEAFDVNCQWVSAAPKRSLTLHIHFRRGNEWWIAVNCQIVHQTTKSIRLNIQFDNAASAKLAERKMREIVELSQQGALVLADAGPLFINNGFARLLGYEDIDSLIASGQVNLANHVHSDDLDLILERAAARMNGEDVPEQYEFRLVRRDGEIIWVSVLASKIVWDGEPASLSWITDVSDRKRAEDAVVQNTDQLRKAKLVAEDANQLKSELLAVMSHEIRTPLNGVIGLSEVLLRSKLNAAQTDMVEIIESSGRTLLAILNDILDLSKLEAGHTKVIEEDSDLHEIVSVVNRLMRPLAEQRDLSLRLEIENDVPELIVCDPGKLQQVLSNLIGNAIKFTAEGGVITRLTTFKDPVHGKPMVTISIIDTGVGISKDIAKKLFHRFVQADSSTSREFGGTGLGLAISKEMIDLMGGEIGCDSIEGYGSTFWVKLPIGGSKARLPISDPIPFPAALT